MLEILIWIVMAVICYVIAEKNGRNKWLALVLGLLFSIFAVVSYLIAGKPKK